MNTAFPFPVVADAGSSYRQGDPCDRAAADEDQPCGGGCTEVRCDRLDGRTLVGADALSAFSVGVGDLVGDVEDEALVVVELLGCGLALEQFDRIAKMLQAVFSELLRRVVAGVIDLRLC